MADRFACPKCGLTSPNSPQPCPICDFIGEPIELPVRQVRHRLKLIEGVVIHGRCAPHRNRATHLHIYDGQAFLCCGEDGCCDLPVPRKQMRREGIRIEMAVFQRRSRRGQGGGGK